MDREGRDDQRCVVPSSRTPSTSRLTTRPWGLLPIDSRVFAPTASSALHEQQDDVAGLKLLGALAFRRGDVEERIPLERPVSLLVYLAMRGSWVDRRELAVLYRPDAAEDTALAYLRKLIHRARLYPFASRLEAERDAVRWLVDSDVRRFRDAVDARDWQTALAAYGGPFLGGAVMTGAPGFSAWQEVEREALESAWLRASDHRAADLEREDHLLEAAAVHRAVLSHDPYAEGNVQALLRLLAKSGRRAEALAIYDTFSRQLSEELGAEPLETTEALADALRHSSAVRSTLPTPGTPLVGRGAEIEEVRGLLRRDDPRLVTILGLGGSGKTRVAIEVARRAAQDGGEATFVSLAAATSVQAVTATILEALGVGWQGEHAEDALVAGLRTRSGLLVLDNFEGAIEAAPLLARVLEAAPDLRLLVTSREPLRLQGEWLIDLGGLPVPPAGTEYDPGTFEAVELFVQQAGRTAPWFAPSAEDLEAIAEICRRLEGLPLAIELAASWSRVLPPAELLTQLERDRAILTSQSRDVSPRHRSLWQVFDHAWERLSEEERRALPRLAVFAGGFDLEAAEAVTGADLGVLMRLMDLKLLRRVRPGRFMLHQLVRQYGLQRISGEKLEIARRVHARYYCARLGRLAVLLKGQDVKAGLDGVQADLANFLAAWNLAVADADAGSLDAAKDAMDNYLYYRAYTLYSDSAEHGRECRDLSTVSPAKFIEAINCVGHSYTFVHDDQDLLSSLTNPAWSLISTDYCTELAPLLKKCTCVKSAIGLLWDVNVPRNRATSHRVRKEVRLKVLLRDSV